MVESAAIVVRHLGAAVDLVIWRPTPSGDEWVARSVRAASINPTGIPYIGHSFMPQPPERA